MNVAQQFTPYPADESTAINPACWEHTFSEYLCLRGGIMTMTVSCSLVKHTHKCLQQNPRNNLFDLWHGLPMRDKVKYKGKRFLTLISFLIHRPFAKTAASHRLRHLLHNTYTRSHTLTHKQNKLSFMKQCFNTWHRQLLSCSRQHVCCFPICSNDAELN